MRAEDQIDARLVSDLTSRFGDDSDSVTARMKCVLKMVSALTKRFGDDSPALRRLLKMVPAPVSAAAGDWKKELVDAFCEAVGSDLFRVAELIYEDGGARPEAKDLARLLRGLLQKGKYSKSVEFLLKFAPAPVKDCGNVPDADSEGDIYGDDIKWSRELWQFAEGTTVEVWEDRHENGITGKIEKRPIGRFSKKKNP
mmetsp:Transcript_8914/g.31238  ORF Transcript_8914/g.31238 Transcript_8914/m.31238 type:complete len:198 (+) Transcript_8914:57-650(+)